MPRNSKRSSFITASISRNIISTSRVPVRPILRSISTSRPKRRSGAIAAWSAARPCSESTTKSSSQFGYVPSNELRAWAFARVAMGDVINTDGIPAPSIIAASLILAAHIPTAPNCICSLAMVGHLWVLLWGRKPLPAARTWSAILRILRSIAARSKTNAGVGNCPNSIGRCKVVGALTRAAA